MFFFVVLFFFSLHNCKKLFASRVMMLHEWRDTRRDATARNLNASRSTVSVSKLMSSALRTANAWIARILRYARR